MRLHNSLTKKLEEFKPLKEGEVSLYSCGPTVYDYAHIGNLRTFVFYDSLRRALEIADYQVRQVMNITDVGHLASDADEGEDKLEKGAAREGKSVWDVAAYYTDAFKKDAELLNILSPNTYHGSQDNYARATDFIKQQAELVQVLLDKGFAYQTQQAIYFDVTKLPSYGQLTGQKLEDKEVAARDEVVTDKNKRHPYDFALWFFIVGHFKNHSMHWSSPWGEGFPGWHLECSAIIHATLGDPIDIHTGAVDLIGTHHTNEMAQTEAAFGNKLANYWLHSQHLLVDGQRMAKSAGNFYTLQDIIKRGFEPLALRLLFLQSHYRSQMNFTWEALAAATQNLKDIQAWADRRFQSNAAADHNDVITKANNQIKNALMDDLNTSVALAQLNQLLDQSVPTLDLLQQLDGWFGLNLANRSDIDEELKGLIRQREIARQSQDWPRADELRHQLDQRAIEINDTASGPIWRRKN